MVKGHISRGKLLEWQQSIGRLCVGNSRFVFAICVALTGPLLEPLGEENFGCHAEGGSSIGKSTILIVAVSIWGATLQSWRTTDNAAEGLARQANDGFLALDELSQVDGFSADAMTYMLGNPGDVFTIPDGLIPLIEGGDIFAVCEKTAVVRAPNRKQFNTICLAALPGEAAPKWRVWASWCEP
jgi:hypothetical protein